MKGFVPTPPDLVDAMVAKLFRNRAPRSDEHLLEPGCGRGAFIEGVLRWCERVKSPIPQLVGIDSDPALLDEARRRLGHVPQVTLLLEDFLAPRSVRYDYVVGNPPYVPITGLTSDERSDYRARYRTASGRFDLYLLFFEQALSLLKPDGRLVFVTPEKFLYVQTAEPLRTELGRFRVEEIELIAESAFGELVTYPTVTTVVRDSSTASTMVRLRDGTRRKVRLAGATSSWLPLVNGSLVPSSGPVLSDAFVRISCGVATGADSVFVMRNSDIPDALAPYAYPTLSGRSMMRGEPIVTTHSMLVPYAPIGTLIPEEDLGPLGDYLREAERHAQLMERTCVARKPWYAFHETPPLAEILRPKILCKDIGAEPWFVIDAEGEIVPRHSLYYLVPADASNIDVLCEYLNSEAALTWLLANCQRAASGFVRLQSHVLKQLPLPEHLVDLHQLAI